MRVTYNQAQWKDIFKEQENSGLTIVCSCRQHEIATAIFYACRKKFDVSQSAFIQVKITQQVEVFTNPESI